MSLNLLTSYRLLSRLAKVATVDSVHGRERLADALKARFRRYKPLRVANVQAVSPEIESEAVLRFLGNSSSGPMFVINSCQENTLHICLKVVDYTCCCCQVPLYSGRRVKMRRKLPASYTHFPAVTACPHFLSLSRTADPARPAPPL